MIVPIEIEDQLLREIEAAAKGQGSSLREFVSQALRSGVAQARTLPTRGFVQQVHDFGKHLESPWTLLGEMETESVGKRK